MDSLTAIGLSLIVLLAPLVAAALAAAMDGAPRRQAPLAVQFGAAVSFGGAVLALLETLVGRQPSQPLNLGTWLATDPMEVLTIPLGLRLDIPAASLIALMSLSTWCGIAWSRKAADASASGPLFYSAASLLLFSAIGVTASTNLGELFVFWQVAGLAAYLLETASPAAAGRGAKKFVLVQRVGDMFLLSGVLVIASGLGTLDIHDLFSTSGRWDGFAARNQALVEVIGLCLFGACTARCGLFPVFGWIEDLADAPPFVRLMIESSCLVPCGAILLFRCFPVLASAMATARFAGFLCGASAFVLITCAGAASDSRRVAGFGCASVFAVTLLGLATGYWPAAFGSLVLLMAMIPSSAAIILGTGKDGRSGKTRSAGLPWPVLLLGFCGVAAGATGVPAMLHEGRNTISGHLSATAAAFSVGCLPALAGLALALWFVSQRFLRSTRLPQDGTLLRLGRNRFYCETVLFLFIALPIRAGAQLARFLDWILIDITVSEMPEQFADRIGRSFEPIQRKSVSFYVLSTLVGTAMLVLVIVSLRGSW